MGTTAATDAPWPAAPALAEWTPEVVQETCTYCFAVLDATLNRRPSPALPKTTARMPSCGVFVTWTKKGALRGCIGCLDPIAPTRIGDYALKAALQDSRFNPITLDEIPSLTCHVSVLHSFETAQHVYDWNIGQHGIILQFSGANSRPYSATYLPEVALEHGMSHEVAVRELVRKSGYKGSVNEVLPHASVTRYESLKRKLEYKEFEDGTEHAQHVLAY
jgi:uncharacterized protein (TIGR00296 family)